MFNLQHISNRILYTKIYSILGTADISLGLSLVIVLLITVIGGIILGSFGGSIGFTFRDLVSVIYTEKRK